MFNYQNLQRESNLAQFREDEAKRIALSQQDKTKHIRLSQQFAQARADKETAFETKAHDSEYNQFLACKVREASSPVTTVRETTHQTARTYRHVAIIEPIVAIAELSSYVAIAEPPSYNLLSLEIQFIHVIMRTAHWMKDFKVSLAIECFDAIYHKLLQINITNIDQLMKGIRTS